MPAIFWHVDAVVTLDHARSSVGRLSARSFESLPRSLRGRSVHEFAQSFDAYQARRHIPSRTPRRRDGRSFGGRAIRRARGPIVGSVTNPADRNVIGAHGGSYALYRALAISARALNPLARPDLHNTHPTADYRAASAMVRARAKSCRSTHGATWWGRSTRRRSRADSTSGPPSRSPRRVSTCPKSSAP